MAELSSLRATAHPLRLQMLSLLTGAELSAAEVARELDISHASASYHLRTLLAADEIVVAGEERVRGGVAKRYRYVIPEARSPRGRRRARADVVGDLVVYERATGQAVVGRLAEVQPSPEQLLSDIETWAVPEVWAEALELMTRASRLLHEQARPARTPGTVRVSATVTAFRMRDRGPRAERDR